MGRFREWVMFGIGICLSVLASRAAELPLVHPLFVDHMVLQRDLPCPVWGWAAPGATVTVGFAGQTVQTTAAADGRWQARLAPMPANAKGQPLTIAVGAADAADPAPTLTIKDVLLGDVWLCSGQSNMEFGITGANQWWNEFPSSPIDGIRLFWVQPNAAFEPVKTVSGNWSVADREALNKKKMPYMSPGFSAIAWMFGRKLHQETGVPIGVIESSQGNTAIQAWSTVESLWEHDPTVEPNTSTLAGFEARLTDWAKDSDPAWETARTWIDPAFDDSDWATMELPAESLEAALPGFNGCVWLRRSVTLDETWAGQAATVHLGANRDPITVWVNGRFVGADDSTRRGLDGKWLESDLALPADLLVAGENVIVVRTLGNLGLTARLDHLELTQAGTDLACTLTGTWRIKAGTPTAELTGRRKQFLRIWAPGGLYNGMIAPLAPFAIRGALWYQGEGNAGQRNYDALLSRMISDWRRDFGVGDFPFYIVQLSNYGPPRPEPYDSSWAHTRELQAKVAREVPNSGLAVSIDWGEKADIHPPNKRQVSERLAALALARVYGKDVPCEGPSYAGMTVEDGTIRVRFDHAEGLRSMGGGPAGLAIAGADKRFVWAQARLDGETLVVWSPEVPEPVAVRYAWADYTMCNLENAAGFPAVPFRTDDW